MVQVQNEPGTWGSVRDYSPAAQKLFEALVPADVLTAMQVKPASPTANWQEASGPEAEVNFHAWAVAKYVGQVAAARVLRSDPQQSRRGKCRADGAHPGWPTQRQPVPGDRVLLPYRLPSRRCPQASPVPARRRGSLRERRFKFLRIWNGDETDWGLNFGAEPLVLRVSVATY
jgi:hypothetical protein